jgi:hypothetical protein
MVEWCVTSRSATSTLSIQSIFHEAGSIAYKKGVGIMLGRIACAVLILSVFSLAMVDSAPAQEPADSAKVAEPADSTVAEPADSTVAAPAESAEPEEVKPPAVLYEKAKLVFDGEAEADGSIGFTFAPDSGEVVLFSVNVLAKTKKKDIAKAVYTELAIAAGEKYKVKQEGDEVRVERAKKDYAEFSLTVEEIALPGVSVLVKKD